MRLITHNMLKCNVAGVENGYPLIIESNVVENVDAEFNAGKCILCLFNVVILFAIAL